MCFEKETKIETAADACSNCYFVYTWNDGKQDRVSEELSYLRKECRSQARKLEDMQHLVTDREDEGDALRSKVRIRADID